MLVSANKCETAACSCAHVWGTGLPLGWCICAPCSEFALFLIFAYAIELSSIYFSSFTVFHDISKQIKRRAFWWNLCSLALSDSYNLFLNRIATTFTAKNCFVTHSFCHKSRVSSVQCTSFTKKNKQTNKKTWKFFSLSQLNISVRSACPDRPLTFNEQIFRNFVGERQLLCIEKHPP